jgi:hypothetical protein
MTNYYNLWWNLFKEIYLFVARIRDLWLVNGVYRFLRGECTRKHQAQLANSGNIQILLIVKFH